MSVWGKGSGREWSTDQPAMSSHSFASQHPVIPPTHLFFIHPLTLYLLFFWSPKLRDKTIWSQTYYTHIFASVSLMKKYGIQICIEILNNFHVLGSHHIWLKTAVRQLRTGKLRTKKDISISGLYSAAFLSSSDTFWNYMLMQRTTKIGKVIEKLWIKNLKIVIFAVFDAYFKHFSTNSLTFWSQKIAHVNRNRMMLWKPYNKVLTWWYPSSSAIVVTCLKPHHTCVAIFKNNSSIASY